MAPGPGAVPGAKWKPCLELGAQDDTPESTNVKFRWKMPRNMHWAFSIKSTGKVTILWKIPLNNEIPLENATESPLENATENPVISEVLISSVQYFAPRSWSPPCRGPTPAPTWGWKITTMNKHIICLFLFEIVQNKHNWLFYTFVGF